MRYSSADASAIHSALALATSDGGCYICRGTGPQSSCGREVAAYAKVVTTPRNEIRREVDGGRWPDVNGLRQNGWRNRIFYTDKITT